MSKLPAMTRATRTFLPQPAEKNEGSHLETETLNIRVRFKVGGKEKHLSKLTLHIEHFSII